MYVTNAPRAGESEEQTAARSAPRNVAAVNHPPHYNAHPSGIECIQITEHMNFNLGNAMKYIWRAGLKSEDAITDLEKARWYVDREIVRLKKIEPGAGGLPPAPPASAPKPTPGPGADANFSEAT